MLKRLGDYFFTNPVVGGLIFVGIVWLLLEIRGILVTVFIAYLLSVTFKPVALALHKKGVPKGLAVGTPYIIALCVVGIIVATLAPFFATQIQSLATNFPLYVDKAGKALGIPLGASDIENFLAKEADIIGQNIISTTSRVFGGILNVVATIAISFYLLYDHQRIEKAVVSNFPEKNQEKLKKTLIQVEQKLGDWLRGELILMLFIGGLTYVVLQLLGVEYALVLAIIAGLLEIIPTIGPIVSSIPAVIVALSINPPLALVVILAYILIQQFENHILVPRVMESAVGLPPVVVILSILVGGSLMGIPGALLAVPIVSVLHAIIQNFYLSE